MFLSCDHSILVAMGVPCLSHWSYEGEEFEVDCLLRHRHSHAGTYEYLVHWKGYDPSFDLWLPETELSSAPDLLAVYKAANGC